MNRKARYVKSGGKTRAIVEQNEESQLRKKLTWNDVKKLGLGCISSRLEILDTGPYRHQGQPLAIPEPKSRRKNKLRLDDTEQR